MEFGRQSLRRFDTCFPRNEALEPKAHTVNPTVTGSGVLGIHFDGGVILAADMLGSYGSLARYRSLPRIVKVNDETVIACMGDYADFQYLDRIIERREIEEQCQEEGFRTTGRSLHSLLTRILYNRRCKIDPLWTTLLVAGYDKTSNGNKPFLGFVDQLGIAFEDPIIATGSMGANLALPLMRKAVEDTKSSSGRDLNEQEARKVIEDALRLLYYRNTQSSNKYQIAVIPCNGTDPARIEGPFEFLGNWHLANYEWYDFTSFPSSNDNFSWFPSYLLI